MSWPARWAGKCGACGEHFEKGADVTWGEGATVVEVNCSGASPAAELAQSAEEIRAMRCTKCWLVHPKWRVDCE
jgi:hypothetical protein